VSACFCPRQEMESAAVEETWSKDCVLSQTKGTLFSSGAWCVNSV
jgi:hypothetical protein